jgi:hypothetical protein
MHVTWHTGRHGRGGYTMVYCFGCQARGEEIVEALGLRLSDLFDEALPERERAWKRVGPSPQRRKAARRRGHLGRLPRPLPLDSAPPAPEPEHAWQEIARYPYVDRDGVVVQYAIRRECAAEGEPHKEFRQSFVASASGREVARKPSGFVPVLYRLPDVLAAVASGVAVWLMEGEKDADAAAADGLVATTNPQGAGSFQDELIADLAGARLKVVLDRDAAGMTRGADLYRRLSGIAQSVELLLPAPTRLKADYFDHQQAGLGPAALVTASLTHIDFLHASYLGQDHATKISDAIVQADLHASLVEAVKDPRYTSAEEHRTHTRRWILEGQIQFERLIEDYTRAELAALKDGSAKAGEDLVEFGQLLETTQTALRACHDRHAEAVPPILRPPADPTSLSGPVDASPSTIANRTGSAMFRTFGGEIVQWKTGKPQPEDEDFDPTADNYKTILSMIVRIAVREFEETAEDAAADEVPTMGRASTTRRRITTVRDLAAVRVRYLDPASGEEMEVRIPAEKWRDHSWLESLPGPVDYDTRRAGKDVVQRAINAISGDMLEKTLHRSTGWYEQPDGQWGFVHARGVITSAGHRDEEVALAAGLERYDLPDPVADPARLREAFFGTSATMLDRLPDRVAAPILGHAYRSALGRHTSTVALVGQKATYKTSIAAKVMNHWGEGWGRTRYGSSMSGQGDTDNAVRFKLHHARDTLYFFDDFAPTDSWAAAQRRLEVMARLVHNQEARDRLGRDGRSVTAGQPPRAAALMTSEVMPRAGSGADRLLAVPLLQHDVSREDLFPLDEVESRHGRALLTASFIAWLAADYLERRNHYVREGSRYAAELAAGGSTDREGEVLGHLWSGWVSMLDFLLDLAAISDAERQQLLTRVDAGLRQALEATVDADQPRTAGGRVLELIRHAFAQGLAHVSDFRTRRQPRMADCVPVGLATHSDRTGQQQFLGALPTGPVRADRRLRVHQPRAAGARPCADAGADGAGVDFEGRECVADRPDADRSADRAGRLGRY